LCDAPHQQPSQRTDEKKGRLVTLLVFRYQFRHQKIFITPATAEVGLAISQTAATLEQLYSLTQLKTFHRKGRQGRKGNLSNPTDDQRLSAKSAVKFSGFYFDQWYQCKSVVKTLVWFFGFPLRPWRPLR
ncbi:MAG TPA: hypothetical protein VNV88_13590, partial [Candidatus Solibacter sp.]|nr:hypothetical protein [Candidatus Solibacter sp.]